LIEATIETLFPLRPPVQFLFLIEEKRHRPENSAQARESPMVRPEELSISKIINRESSINGRLPKALE
jgi:hypothetical protein